MDDTDLGAAMGQYAAEQKVEKLEERLSRLERLLEAIAGDDPIYQRTKREFV